MSAARDDEKNPTGVKIHSVKYNVVMNMIMTTSSFIFPLITTPYISRVLSTEGTGAVSFAQSVANYFSLVALLGVNYYGTNACAKVREDKAALSQTVKEILILLALSTALVSIVYCGCFFFVPQFQTERALFTLFGVYIWLMSFGAEWLYQALEQYDYITVRNISFKVISLIFMFLFVHARKDYIIYGAIVVFASGGSNVLNFLRLHKLLDFRNTGKANIRRHLKPMKWFAIAITSSGMYISVDLVLLGFLGTTHMVGLYQLVSKIKSVLVSGVNAVGGVMLPRLSHYQAKGDVLAGKALIAKNINFVLVVSMEIISILALCSREIVLIMGGPDFMESALPLTAVGPAVMFSALNIVLANHLITCGKESNWAVTNLLGLLFAVMMNMVLIPRYGVLGSAISISLCEGLMFAMRSFVCRDLLKDISNLIDPHKILFCALISSLVVYFLSHTFMIPNVFLHIIVFVALYSMCYLGLLIITKEKIVRDILR